MYVLQISINKLLSEIHSKFRFRDQGLTSYKSAHFILGQLSQLHLPEWSVKIVPFVMSPSSTSLKGEVAGLLIWLFLF